VDVVNRGAYFRVFSNSRPQGYEGIATVQGGPDVEGDARLIAAAPEMLEALRQIIRLVGDPEQTLADIVNCAAAAIAKATGGDK